MADFPDISELEQQLDPAARAILAVIRSAFGELKSELEKQRAENAELRRMLFGRSSERLPPIDSEVRRVMEAEELLGQDDAADAAEGEQEPPSTNRRKRGRKKSEKARKARRRQRKQLPVVHERVVVTPDQLPEGYSLNDFRDVGDGEIVRRVEYVREHIVVVEYVLQKVASKDGEHIISAATPVAVADGGHYGPGIYAHVVVAKCADSLPLYRIEKALGRSGCPIARSTLCGLFHRAAELLAPIATRLLELARGHPYLCADETTIPVQQSGGCRKGWIWTLVSPEVIGYRFSDTRAGQTIEELLQGTTGYLQTDGYAGYNGVCEQGGRTRVGCWSHSRRMFFRSLETAPEARDVLDLIVELYRVEHHAAELAVLGTAAHLELRRRDSSAVIDKIEKWLDEHEPDTPPESPLGKAITYARNQWDTLIVFLADPKLRLDNNLSENALRIMALGRKNFLNVGHDVAGSNLAVLQTIVATCRLHDVNPVEYIEDVLIRVQTHPASHVDELLPQSWEPSPTTPADSTTS